MRKSIVGAIAALCVVINYISFATATDNAVTATGANLAEGYPLLSVSAPVLSNGVCAWQIDFALGENAAQWDRVQIGQLYSRAIKSEPISWLLEDENGTAWINMIDVLKQESEKLAQTDESGITEFDEEAPRLPVLKSTWLAPDTFGWSIENLELLKNKRFTLKLSVKENAAHTPDSGYALNGTYINCYKNNLLANYNISRAGLEPPHDSSQRESMEKNNETSLSVFGRMGIVNPFAHTLIADTNRMMDNDASEGLEYIGEPLSSVVDEPTGETSSIFFDGVVSDPVITESPSEIDSGAYSTVPNLAIAMASPTTPYMALSPMPYAMPLAELSTAPSAMPSTALFTTPSVIPPTATLAPMAETTASAILPTPTAITYAISPFTRFPANITVISPTPAAPAGIPYAVNPAMPTFDPADNYASSRYWDDEYDYDPSFEYRPDKEYGREGWGGGIMNGGYDATGLESLYVANEPQIGSQNEPQWGEYAQPSQGYETPWTYDDTAPNRFAEYPIFGYASANPWAADVGITESEPSRADNDMITNYSLTDYPVLESETSAPWITGTESAQEFSAIERATEIIKQDTPSAKPSEQRRSSAKVSEQHPSDSPGARRMSAAARADSPTPVPTKYATATPIASPAPPSGSDNGMPNAQAEDFAQSPTASYKVTYNRAKRPSIKDRGKPSSIWIGVGATFFGGALAALVYMYNILKHSR
ncbi:MAG: hypothetical protein LBL96_09995 [Clostridiales bacterium]|nr:hypothetical protein [Clostridiales bacterium]